MREPISFVENTNVLNAKIFKTISTTARVAAIIWAASYTLVS